MGYGIKNSPIIKVDNQAIQSQLDDIASNGIQIGVGTKHGYFSILDTRTTIDYHAFEDWVQLNTTDTELGYASFDAKPTMNNNLDQNHLVGYQARQIYNGSGNLTNYLHGFDYKVIHNGTGTITNATGLYLYDVTGTGQITNNYGIYIEPFNKGTNHYEIYSAGNNNFFQRIITPSIVSSNGSLGINYDIDIAGKGIAIGYGGSTATNFGKIDIYDGKVTKIGTIDQTGLTITNITLSGLLHLPKYTWASLPSATEGTLAYCTDGLKQGETTGHGTGVVVYYSGVWKRLSDDSTVAH